VLALSTVVIAVVDLCTGTLSKPAVGNNVVAIFTGYTCAAAAVASWRMSVCGYACAAGRPAPVAGSVDLERDSHGESDRFVHDLPAARIDRARPTMSMDPLRVFRPTRQRFEV
jgi:hypothetical protein